jgi:hypothetical protein
MWIKNTLGKPDATLTFAFIAFIVTTFNVLLSTIDSFSLGGFNISFESLDAAVMSTYLGIAFSAYVGRRWTDTKYVEAPVKLIDKASSSIPTTKDVGWDTSEREPPEVPPSFL